MKSPSPMLTNAIGGATFSSAFERVKENHGCAGVDGMTIKEFETSLGHNLQQLREEVLDQKYKPLPLLKILVDKGNGEPRALSIPAVRDRVVQAAVLQTIEPVLDKEFEHCSFGYRKGRSVKQAIYQIKEYYEKGYQWVVDADVDAFFDSVDHDILLKKVRELIKDKYLVSLIHLWVKAEIWDGREIVRLAQGIPQGSVISPILANLFLDQLDEELMGRGYKLVRYADDFIVLCKKKEEAEKAIEVTGKILEGLNLLLDEADVVSFDQGFKYLGVYFVRSMIMAPFDRPKKERRILYYPPPLNLTAYLLKREKGW